MISDTGMHGKTDVSAVFQGGGHVTQTGGVGGDGDSDSGATSLLTPQGSVSHPVRIVTPSQLFQPSDSDSLVTLNVPSSRSRSVSPTSPGDHVMRLRRPNRLLIAPIIQVRLCFDHRGVHVLA